MFHNDMFGNEISTQMMVEIFLNRLFLAHKFIMISSNDFMTSLPSNQTLILTNKST